MASRCKMFASALAIATAASPATAEDLTPSGDPAPLRAVRLVEPEVRDVSRTRSFFGRVAARETVALSFEVGGRLVALDAPEGSRVPAGSTLARLDGDPFERAVERAALALEQATRDATRAATLAERRVAADVAAEDAATGRDLADVALRDAREALADAVLTAPFDGLVAERIAPLFSNVTPGQPILRLHDMSEVRVEIDVPERVLLGAGDVRAIGFAGRLPNGTVVPLTLAEFEATTGQVGQSFRVSLRLPTDATDGLIPGTSMTVEAKLPEGDRGAVVPAGAVLANTKRGFEVMVFDPDPDAASEGTVTRQEVVLRAPTGASFEIDGLPDGARIVAAGGHLLADGERVRIYDGLRVEEP